MNRHSADPRCNDAALVQRAQRGDRAALADLIDRYQDRVYNTCYRLCHDEADALDLTQATFLKAIEGLPRFEGRAGFFTWLFRIAVNLAFSQRRSQQRRRVVALAESEGAGDPAAPATAPAASAGLEREETRQRVATALAQLDPEFRAAIVLKDIEGLDYAEIAEIMEIPVGTVKSRIYRGRTQLREMLAEETVQREQRSA